MLKIDIFILFRCFSYLNTLLTRNSTNLNIVVDLELAAINAFTSVYPSCQITACSFHVSQCLWRKLQQEDLQTIYSIDVDFAVNAKMLAALAFVPLQDKVKAFE